MLWQQRNNGSIRTLFQSYAHVKNQSDCSHPVVYLPGIVYSIFRPSSGSGSGPPLTASSPHRLLSSLANLQQRIQAMRELKPPIRKINPVASLPPPSASPPILRSTCATFSTVGGGLTSAPGPTPAPACPAPGSTPLFSPGLPSNIAKTNEETPVTRNWGMTMATL